MIRSIVGENGLKVICADLEIVACMCMCVRVSP